MAVFQGILFLALGVGLLIVDYQSLSRGWLPCGPNGFARRLEFHKHDQPIGYWAMFTIYGMAGLTLAVFALRLLSGSATPLPLH